MKCDVIVVGGGPASIITALTAKSVYPGRSVCIIKEIGDGVIPCAIPYMIHTMSDPLQNIMGNKPLENAGVEIVVDKVVSLDTAAKRLTLGSGKEAGEDRRNQYLRDPRSSPNPGNPGRLLHQDRQYLLCQRRGDLSDL